MVRAPSQIQPPSAVHRAGPAGDHHPEQGDDGDRKCLLKIRLGAGEPAGNRIERRQRLVARADVPLAAVLLRLEVNRREDVNEEQ